MAGWAYILASAPYGALYIGVTAAKRYGVHRMVRGHPDAIHREKRLKKWNRRWKIDLIEHDNPRGTTSTRD